jgi:hypothetical protein
VLPHFGLNRWKARAFRANRNTCRSVPFITLPDCSVVDRKSF